MTGDAFIIFAGKLVAASHPDEATLRSAISRAYYGAFHVAAAYLRGLGFPLGDRHASVWQHLIVANHSPAMLAGHKLSSLYSQRRRADYFLVEERRIDLRLARQCVEEAAEIAGLIESCGNDSVVDEIRAAIQAFRERQRGPALEE